MSKDELRDALDGLFAYDMGSHDSGIHDENLREQAKKALASLGRTELAKFIRQFCLSDGAIANGYGCEDHIEFLKWLRDDMDDDLMRDK